LVSTPTNVVVVGCRWVYTLKFRPDESLDRYRPDSWPKVTLGPMTSIIEAFSPIVQMNTTRILFSVAVNLSWPFQPDVKNMFLYWDLRRRCI